jgi:hypothetical protein
LEFAVPNKEKKKGDTQEVESSQRKHRSVYPPHQTGSNAVTLSFQNNHKRKEREREGEGERGREREREKERAAACSGSVSSKHTKHLESKLTKARKV